MTILDSKNAIEHNNSLYKSIYEYDGKFYVVKKTTKQLKINVFDTYKEAYESFVYERC